MSVTTDDQGLTESDNIKDSECHENLETGDNSGTDRNEDGILREEEQIESENTEENNENQSDELDAKAETNQEDEIKKEETSDKKDEVIDGPKGISASKSKFTLFEEQGKYKIHAVQMHVLKYA